MSDWFEWCDENLFGNAGGNLHFLGSARKRFGEDKWDAHAQGEPVGVFVSEAAARRRVEEIVRGTRPAYRGPARSRAGT